MVKKSNLESIRHSLSHILAMAVLEWDSKAKLGIGPAIENGFYYDFEPSKPLKPEELPDLEKKMKDIIKKPLKFEKKILSFAKALKVFKKQPYKQELIKDLPKGEKISAYQTGNFIDLCKGPHVKSTEEIFSEGLALTKVAGAYWKGNEKNPMLVRIYGLAFKTEKELEQYFEKEKKAEASDHRKLGQILDLYSINDEVGAGLIIWHPKGALIREIIEDFWKEEHKKRGYQYVFTPHIGNLSLWQTSSHTKFYKENMYPPMEIEGQKYQLKPMNCPFHIQIYKSKIRSYKDLPIKYCELGDVYRYERAGTLHGLLRTRSITQDDAHIFCTPQQLLEEIKKILDLTFFILESFGFKQYKISLSVRDPKNKKKYLGSEKIWQEAEKALAQALDDKKLRYCREEGEAVFYGPKIDTKLIDAFGRGWQGPTTQLDFNLPEKFDLNYINKKGKKEGVVMVHRTVLGAMGRFIGNLLEHYSGVLPIWLSPVQVQIIPVASRHKKYAQQVASELALTKGLTKAKIKAGLTAPANQIRAEIADQNETVAKKIREGEIQKIPYLLVVGDKEAKSKSVRVRDRKKGDLGIMKIDKFIEKIQDEIKEKK